MRQIVLLGLAAMLFSCPAHATAGLFCETTEGPERAFAFGAGHHPVATWWGHEIVDGEAIPVEVGQQWTDEKRLFIDIIDSEKLERLARIMAHRTEGLDWVGTLTTVAGEQSIRCTEA